MGKIATPQEITESTQESTYESKPDQGKRVISEKDKAKAQEALESTFGFDTSDKGVEDDVLKYYSIRKKLGVEPTDTSQDSKIEKILAWAKDRGVEDKAQLFREIKHLDYKLGNPNGKSKLKKIYEYITITGQIRNLVDKQVILENGA